MAILQVVHRSSGLHADPCSSQWSKDFKELSQFCTITRSSSCQLPTGTNSTSTVKFGYNEQLGPDQTCSWVDLCGKMVIRSEYFVRYNRVFVITEFVITVSLFLVFRTMFWWNLITLIYYENCLKFRYLICNNKNEKIDAPAGPSHLPWVLWDFSPGPFL